MKNTYQEYYSSHNHWELFHIARLRQHETLLVFFHGIGDSYLNFIGFFTEPSLMEYDLFIADLLGHGRSSAAENYSFDNQADALVEQLSPLLPNYKNVVFVPHSMGGIHATLLAAYKFSGKVNGVFAVETSVTQYGSFIAQQVTEIIKQKQPFSPWFKNFLDNVYKDQGINNHILQTYYVGLRLVREEAFLSNALEMFSLATALSDKPFSHKIGQLFATLSIPKVYCLGSLGKQLPSIPFLQENHIDIEYFPTDCHWVAQACLSKFCDKLVQFVRCVADDKSLL